MIPARFLMSLDLFHKASRVFAVERYLLYTMDMFCHALNSWECEYIECLLKTMKIVGKDLRNLLHSVPSNMDQQMYKVYNQINNTIFFL